MFLRSLSKYQEIADHIQKLSFDLEYKMNFELKFHHQPFLKFFVSKVGYENHQNQLIVHLM